MSRLRGLVTGLGGATAAIVASHKSEVKKKTTLFLFGQLGCIIGPYHLQKHFADLYASYLIFFYYSRKHEYREANPKKKIGYFYQFCVYTRTLLNTKKSIKVSTFSFKFFQRKLKEVRVWYKIILINNQ